MFLFRRASKTVEQDRRSFPRHKVDCRAVLVTSTGNRSGRLVDISQAGASVRVKSVPAAGCSALLEWITPDGARREALGKIVRVTGDVCAVEFERVLPKAEIDQCLANDDARLAVRTFGQRRSAIN